MMCQVPQDRPRLPERSNPREIPWLMVMVNVICLVAFSLCAISWTSGVAYFSWWIAAVGSGYCFLVSWVVLMTWLYNYKGDFDA